MTLRATSLWKLAIPALIFVLTGCDEINFGDSDRYKDDFHYSYPLSAGGRLSLEGFNGSVDIMGWDKESVEINGTKYASTPERLAEIKVDIDAQKDAIRVRTIRPTMRGNMGVRYSIRVPHRVVLDQIVSSNGAIRIEDVEGQSRLKSSNGQVKITRVKGNIEAETTNGQVEITETSGQVRVHTSNGGVRADINKGSLEATTSNGSIRASLRGGDSTHPITLHSSNGGIDLTLDTMQEVRADSSNSSITVRLPAAANARVRAHTSNSSITTDFGVTTVGSISKHHLEGNIGGGGPMLDLSTSNGGIRILKN
ncbi:MAG: hypothetical protein ABI823_06145 [Bryobacteraceae bacterium]